MTNLSTRVDLDPIAALTYSTLAQLETDSKAHNVTLAVRAPTSLFGVAMLKSTVEAVPGGGGLEGWS